MKIYPLTFAAALVGAVLGAISLPGLGQVTENSAAVPLAATASTSIPALVPYAGVAVNAEGKPLTGAVSITFLIFKDPRGGEPLWHETEIVTPDSAGKFSVQLGSTQSSGLSPALFVNGEARWLEIQIAGQAPKDRTLLTSVPYAFKSADAESLAGHTAADFVTQEQFAQLSRSVPFSAPQSAAAASVQPNTAGTVTGSGTSGTVPLWTGALTQGNSDIFQVGQNIGINEATPGATLDVNGTTTFRGTVSLPAYGTATPSSGYRSELLDLSSSAWSTTTNGPVTPTWRIYAGEGSNNTANPTGSLNFQFQNGAGAAATTVLSISQTGVINFAPTQTFPAQSSSFPKGATFGAESSISGSSTDWMLVATNTSGTSKGTILGQASAAGIGVEGASPGGTGVKGVTDTGYGVYGIANTSGTAVYGAAYGTGPAGSFWSQNTAGPAVTVSNVAGGNGLVSSSTVGIGVSGSTTSGSGVYGFATTGSGVTGVASTGSAGTFSNIATFNPTIDATNGGAGNAGVFNNNSASRVALAGVNVSTDANAIATYGNVSNGKAVYGIATAGTGVYGTSTTGVGVYGTSGGAVGTDAVAGVAAGSGNGVYGFSPNGTGVYASTTDGVAVYANGANGTYGVDAEAVDGTAVLGHSQTDYGGFFQTDNSDGFALAAYNAGSGGIHTLFKVFRAGSRNGSCGVGDAGSLSCTGQIKTLVDAGGGTRKVETYAMQSPENWMEDFGSGELHKGVAVVKIDPTFAETVSETSDYHVFITPNGDSKGLYVIRKTANTFEVRESGGGTSSLSFDYRIVAKRRGLETQRLVDVTERYRAEIAAPRPKQSADRAAPTAPAQ